MRREHAVIVYNGELYNTAEVRTDLAKQGYVFSTHSDTEVVLTAYLAWGEACLERLNGIYAFAVWDMQKQELFFARDRIGVKPFFFTEKNGTFLFASEIKTLLAHPDISAEIDGNGISELVLLVWILYSAICAFTITSAEVRAGRFLYFRKDLPIPYCP